MTGYIDWHAVGMAMRHSTLVCKSCGKPVERTSDDDWQHETVDDGLACPAWPVLPARTTPAAGKEKQ